MMHQCPIHHIRYTDEDNGCYICNTKTINKGVEKKMIYEEEAEKVISGGNWVNLGVGIHKITFLEDVPPPTKVKKIFDGKEKEQEQSDVLVEYQGQRKKLTLTKGETIKSLWGQLMVFGKHHKSLVGKTVDILVKSGKDKNGKEKKDYSILQVAELLQKQTVL